MATLFQKPQGPTRINQVQLNQSVLGYAVPVVMGRGKVQQSILWTDGFSFKKVSPSGGGKGFGGGKGGTQYVYSADVIAALCNGPIAGVADVWSGQSWLSNTNTAETYTITGGTPVYPPVNAANLAADLGVSRAQAYSSTHTDLGSDGPVTLSGSDNVPFRRVPYLALLGSGDYSINPATNAYNFSSADVGVTVQIGYSFSLDYIKQQETDLVPSGQTINVGGSLPFSADGGVIYMSGPNNGKAFTRVSGTPTAAGTYSVSGSGPATYHFAAGDVGVEVLITFKINNSAAIPNGTPNSLKFTLFEGEQSQAIWAFLRSNFPGAALGYTGIAYVAYQPMDLGYGAQIQQNVFEVLTADSYGGGIDDCNPVQCILQVLTNNVWGLGAGPVPFPVSAIDNGAGGTWGGGTPGVRSADGTAWSWFAANGFFISPVIDRQDTAASLMSRWLEAGQVAAFMSEGLLKLVPYGDTSTAGNGCTWIAPSAFATALDDTCFVIKSKGQDPVKISSSPWQDAYNVVQVQWNNRSNQYAPEITPESDQAAINRYGSRIEDPQTWDFITTLPAATFAASMRVKRNVYTRNTYEFTLPYTFAYLEPMDVVDITTSSQWAAGNNNTLGIVNLPVRITKIVDNPDGTLDITAEDYPFGVHQPTIYNKQLAAGEVQPNFFADPGNSEVVLFEATQRLTGFQGNQIWIGACGLTDDWGSCNVLVSMDGTTYKQIGVIDTPARLGALGAAFASGSDPDTTDSLVINLAENCLALEAGTTADADADNTLCFVDGELVSYSAIAVTGQNQYTATSYIRRGRMGSAVAAHASGGLFMRLDDAVFKFTYDPSWAGKTIHLKFQSVNSHGNSAQDISALTAVSFTIPGLNPGTVDASTGLVFSQYLPPNVAPNSACNAELSSSYNSTSGTSSVSVIGPGGAGTNWTNEIGGISYVYPSGTITGVPAGSGPYVVVYDTRNGTFSLVSTSTPQDALNDFFVVIPGAITAAAATGGPTSGGAPSGGFGGGRYYTL